MTQEVIFPDQLALDGIDFENLEGVEEEGEDNSPLASTDEAVMALTRPEREARLELLLEDANDIFERTIAEHITEAPTRKRGVNFKIAATCVLFSGGNDSTVLTHMFRDRVDFAVHANTTIGIEETRAFVRETSATFGLPLIERKPPREQDWYRNLVLRTGYSDTSREPLGGFPGPAMHWLMWTRLKERALEQVRNELVADPYAERVVFVAGRRRAESNRRSRIPKNGRKGSIVWVSPLLHWTKPDLNTYRLKYGNVPRNLVADTLHLSGECLCAAFQAPGEREQIDYFYPMALEEVREIEAILQRPEYDHIPPYRKVYGWGAIPELRAQAKAWELVHKSGGTCESCDSRQLSILDTEGGR